MPSRKTLPWNCYMLLSLLCPVKHVALLPLYFNLYSCKLNCRLQPSSYLFCEVLYLMLCGPLICYFLWWTALKVAPACWYSCPVQSPPLTCEPDLVTCSQWTECGKTDRCHLWDSVRKKKNIFLFCFLILFTLMQASWNVESYLLQMSNGRGCREASSQQSARNWGQQFNRTKNQNPTNTLWATLEVNIPSVQLSLRMTKALDNTWSPSYDRSWATGPNLAMVAPDP